LNGNNNAIVQWYTTMSYQFFLFIPLFCVVVTVRGFVMIAGLVFRCFFRF